MARFYIVDDTGEEQTAKVADPLVETIRGRGHDVTVADVTTVDSTTDIDGADAVAGRVVDQSGETHRRDTRCDPLAARSRNGDAGKGTFWKTKIESIASAVIST